MSRPDTAQSTFGKHAWRQLEVPADFEHRLGCLCVTHYLAFYLYEDGQVVCDNGVLEDAIDHKYWNTWISEPEVAKEVAGWALPKAVQEPLPALIFDTVQRSFLVAPEKCVREFLYRYYTETNGLPYI